MKVFLSWSGHKSHQIAISLKEWLPLVINELEPYVSSVDIDKGARWSTDIARELETSNFGILCVTKGNHEAPWLLFEAGALSKSLGKSSICPFLLDLKISEIKGPLVQFQSTKFEKKDIKKLIKSLNNACEETALKDHVLNKVFDKWWPSLEGELKNINSSEDEIQPELDKGDNTNSAILEEILELSRTNQKILSSPDLLFSQEFLNLLLEDRNPIAKKEKKLHERKRHLTLELKHNMNIVSEIMKEYKKTQRPIDAEFEYEVQRMIDIIEHNLIEDLY